MKLSSLKTIYPGLIMAAVAMFLIFSNYYGIAHYRYAVPPGDDGIRHMTVAQKITDTGSTASDVESFDPPGFHILLSSLSQLTGASIIDTTRFFLPALVIISILSVYLVTNRLFGRSDLAVLAVLVYAFFSPQPEHIYSDGTYLNLFAAAYILPIALAFLVQSLFSKNTNTHSSLLLGLLLSAGVLLSHSLSSIYLALIIGTTLLGLLWSQRAAFWHQKRYLWLVVGLLIWVPFIWPLYLGGTVEKVLASLGLVTISTDNILSADFSNDISPIPVLGDYYWLLNRFVILLGVLGVALLPWFTKRRHEAWFLIGWVAILLLSSRFSFFALPMRFARDLAIPLSILAAIGIFQAIRLLPASRYRAAIVALSLLILPWGVAEKAAQATQYNSLIRVQRADTQAFEWLREHSNPDDVILGVPRTIVAGDWGSFINLATGRNTLDGTLCPTGDPGDCDPIYHPNTAISLQYYVEQSIDYVYAGKVILGSFVNKDRIDWSYPERLAEAPFLEQVAQFKENDHLGSVTIFRVDHDKLQAMLSSVTQ